MADLGVGSAGTGEIKVKIGAGMGGTISGNNSKIVNDPGKPKPLFPPDIPFTKEQEDALKKATPTDWKYVVKDTEPKKLPEESTTKGLLRNPKARKDLEEVNKSIDK